MVPVKVVLVLPMLLAVTVVAVTTIVLRLPSKLADPINREVPPTCNSPLMPVPPTTTRAPVVALVVAVPDPATTLPRDVNIPVDVKVVNVPGAGVTAPMVTPLMPPPATLRVLAVNVPMVKFAKLVATMFASVAPELLVKDSTKLLPDSLQYNATFDTNPLARFIKKPTSTFAEADPALRTVIGSLV
jgi:hypothetical protein